MVFASRMNRFLGQMLDGGVGVGPMLLAAVVMRVSSVLGGILLLASVAWALFYYLLADGLHGGQSLGKQWLGMRVVSDETGEPCSFGQSFVRNILGTFLGPLDWVFIFGERHQRLGDMLAGTVVVIAD